MVQAPQLQGLRLTLQGLQLWGLRVLSLFVVH
jgi:hypothetical protein